VTNTAVACGDLRCRPAGKGSSLPEATEHGVPGRIRDRRSGGNASEYTVRTSTQIETAAPGLDQLNKGVFISVAGRQPAGVIYETYLVE
jgi:Protein of unknown function (DUF3237)